jgi:hypothetical protein
MPKSEGDPMSACALYNVLFNYKDIHKVVVELAESLTDEQLRWRPEHYSTSIGFHLWHLGREADYLKAAIMQYYPQLGPDFGAAEEIWQRDELARKWGFPAELQEAVGTGLSDEAAASLPIPAKDELLAYLRQSYAALEKFIELLDTRHVSFEHTNEEMRKTVENVRMNLLVFLTHDCRHLGMMECLKGLQTGFGSATERRN